MAEPITAIKRTIKSETELEKEKLNELQSLLVEHGDALEKLLNITGELDRIGAIDGLQAMLDAKEDIAKIGLEQITREPITNLINHGLNLSAIASSISPEVTEKLSNSIKIGMDEAEEQLANDDKVSILSLMKAINDPDINRAMKFGLHFLKGMGKGLK
ncbi:DUF1641 domain-containing protein [Pseudogracilibacillus auburnensis]|uniref:Uncharacterized protein YjgD (DUF1641 family) n=1 Tax=Pseudogracilibacillus auburnensis TaxID=1494959 RepID=A0A2V3VPP4_9BACI|nr:DUF1641 domain-containing protein [Pseudogracilibacillus auburnensis]MBO1001323.1 DUF1641 domain-containing protein [Pseudogracilibacillus auburnensis]PXW83812.1 uncharacterized protein YjgD (DUF1641 family) [Pseudogracilibacillus auburnensis]